MESLSDTIWDVVIAGTGLPQSLLALSLSRSGKKVLHVDKNDYYGGADAALSLQEAGEWVKRINDSATKSPFGDAEIITPSTSATSEASQGNPKLSFSRAYSLSLSPQLLYSTSRLIGLLVSSKVYRQLEFQAVGSWWILKNTESAAARSKAEGDAQEGQGSESGPRAEFLQRVPGSREDVFADESLDARSQRALMKLLRFVSQFEEDEAPVSEDLDVTLFDFLTRKFNIPASLHPPILVLSLSPHGVRSTSARYALPRIRRHLGSIGVFGPGFGAVIPKWGGNSEIAQVACRAGAVGGGIYVLDCGIDSIEQGEPQANGVSDGDRDEELVSVQLSKGESVKAKWIVGSAWDLPDVAEGSWSVENEAKYARSITVVASTLEGLFPVTAENGPIPAGAVVVMPGEASQDAGGSESPPIYLNIRSSDTGECPTGQSVIYASTVGAGPASYAQLSRAVELLLQAFHEDPARAALWSLRYTLTGSRSIGSSVAQHQNRVFLLDPPLSSLDFDDQIISSVQQIWEAIRTPTDGTDEFMKFTDREAYDEDPDGDE